MTKYLNASFVKEEATLGEPEASDKARKIPKKPASKYRTRTSQQAPETAQKGKSKDTLESNSSLQVKPIKIEKQRDESKGPAPQLAAAPCMTLFDNFEIQQLLMSKRHQPLEIKDYK
jgi:hypothetical protein